MNATRRQFLQRTSLAAAFALTPSTLLAATQNKLPIPPLMDIGRGRPVRLDFRPVQKNLETGKLVEVWGVNGQALAPTIRMRSGDVVRLTYLNNLPQPLSINIQGLLAASEMVGSIQHPIASNNSWSPILTVDQPACSGWYHANTQLHSAYQVSQGLAGFWLIEDSDSRKSTLPQRYGVDDIPLMLQDRDNRPLTDTPPSSFFGKQLWVNGQLSPYLDVPRGWVRLRIVNASLSRRYELRLDNGKPLYLIATGVGFLATPQPMESVSLAPSERVELLIDLNDGQKVSLISGQKRGFFYTIERLFSADDDLIDNLVLELRPQGLASAFNQTPQLPPFNHDDFKLKVAQERQFVIRPLDRLINQQRFDPKRIDFTAQKGTVERWTLTSNSPVGFTLQGAKFIIETQNQKAFPTQQLAWRDTLWLEKDQTTTILVRFDHTASSKRPFTFGVSDLVLKDRGAMGVFEVVK